MSDIQNLSTYKTKQNNLDKDIIEVIANKTKQKIMGL